MGYQAWAFDDPFAFIKAQMVWVQRSVPESMLKHAAALIKLEPIWSVYTPGCECHWGNTAPRDDAILNLQFANPIFFLGTMILIIVGAWKRWLDRSELLLSAGLLLIPYVMQSYRMCMVSHARFASVVFPVYIVLGHLLARMPRPVAWYLLFCSGLLMACYAGLFSSWYWFF